MRSGYEDSYCCLGTEINTCAVSRFRDQYCGLGSDISTGYRD